MHFTSGMDSATLTFILAGGQGKRLSPFTSGMAKPLVSFGGVFRIIDFTLSNCVNSGLKSAYLLTQFKADSVRKYIEASSWTTDFVCLPASPLSGYRGTADSVYKNMHLFSQEKPDFVLILASDHVYKMDYRKLIRFHASHGADATIVAAQHPRRLARELGVLDIDERGQVVGFEEKPEHPRASRSDPSKVLASMGIYVFNTSTLRKALLRDAGNFNGSHEFGKDIFPSLIRTDRVLAYDFAKNNGPLGPYWRDVGNIDAYYRTHMELLLLHSTFDPYGDARWPVYAGGQYASFQNAFMDSACDANSIIAPDAEVSGATIQQSVISPSVHAAPSAQIHGSILMPGVHVGRDAKVQHAIIGEGVVVPDGERIGCDILEDSRRFQVSENGVVAVHGAHAFRSGSSSPTIRNDKTEWARVTGVFETSTHKLRRDAARK